VVKVRVNIRVRFKIRFDDFVAVPASGHFGNYYFKVSEQVTSPIETLFSAHHPLTKLAVSHPLHLGNPKFALLMTILDR
jgi:hypothetical protein